MKLKWIFYQPIVICLYSNGLKKDFNRLGKNGWISGSQPFLSATQIWVWWTPRDLSLKQRMKK